MISPDPTVFLSVRPIVLSPALSTICSSTTFSSRRRRVHFGAAGRGWPASQGDQLGFRGAIENPPRGGVGIVLARQNGFKAFLDELPSRPLDRRDAGVQRLGNSAVAPSLARLRHVRFQQDAGFRQQMPGPLALADKFPEPGALLLAQPHHVLLDGNFFAGHESSPSRDRDGTDSDNPVKRYDVSH